MGDGAAAKAYTGGGGFRRLFAFQPDGPPDFVSIRKNYVVDYRRVTAISISRLVSIRILDSQQRAGRAESQRTAAGDVSKGFRLTFKYHNTL
jgi:hypothetical protein